MSSIDSPHVPLTTPSSGALASWAKSLLLFVLLAGLAFFLETRFSALSRGTDFPDFYCAARMLVAGHGDQLYDVDLQRQFQTHYAERVGTLYIHPPFETLVYLPVAWLPLRKAYLLWCLVNICLLALAARIAQPLTSWDWKVTLIASLMFAPILLCLLQGQDSVLLLLLMTLGFVALRRRREFAAGCWFALGLFKFQLVLPVVFVLAFRKSRLHFLAGFTVVALVLAGISAAISGWSIFAIYAKFLLQLPMQQFAGVIPRAMANFRGLASLIFGGSSCVIAVALISIVFFLITVFVCQRPRPASGQMASAKHGVSPELDWPLVPTVLFALLVSYHLNPHDLSLGLLPIAVLLRETLVKPQILSSFSRWLIAGLCLIFFLPPVHVLALATHLYALLSIPLIALFVASAWGTWKQREQLS
jgi:hypothetical protein